MGNICTFKSSSATNNKKVEFDTVVKSDQANPDQDQDQDINKELLEFVESKPLLNIVSDSNIPRKSSRSDPPPTTIELSKDSIVNSVITKFVERSNLGFKKYGKTLDRKDLTPRDWVQHMEEELMDGILYLEKLRREISEYELEEKTQKIDRSTSISNDLKIAPSKKNPEVPMYRMPEEWDHFVSLQDNNNNNTINSAGASDGGEDNDNDTL